jgi:hypothetical protein
MVKNVVSKPVESSGPVNYLTALKPVSVFLFKLIQTGIKTLNYAQTCLGLIANVQDIAKVDLVNGWGIFHGVITIICTRKLPIEDEIEVKASLIHVIVTRL